MATSQDRGEVVVITGGSAGVGRAVAQRFARSGAKIALLARGAERLESAKREIESLGGQAIVHVGDVADPAMSEALAARAEEAFGPIDVWVSNAMTSVYSAIWDTPPEEIRRVTEVTYLGAVYGIQAALRRMMPRNCGAIVQVGSSLAYRSIPLQSAYCAAKHALHGFIDSLRSELIGARKDIRLSMVQLPSMNTPQFLWVKSRLAQKAKPPPPIYQPEVAADAIQWAAHHDRREVYVSGMTSIGIKANKLVPGWLDRYMVKHSFSDTHELRDPNQPDNLWQPAPGDYGAHGPFDADAQAESLQLELSKRRTPLALFGLGVAGTMLLASRSGRRRTPR